MATHTPIPYFESLPWLRVRDWFVVVAKIRPDGD
jgi:hypothetical protein